MTALLKRRRGEIMGKARKGHDDAGEERDSREMWGGEACGVASRGRGDLRPPEVRRKRGLQRRTPGATRPSHGSSRPSST